MFKPGVYNIGNKIPQQKKIDVTTGFHSPGVVNLTEDHDKEVLASQEE